MLNVEKDGKEFCGPYGLVPIGKEALYTANQGVYYFDEHSLKEIDEVYGGVPRPIRIDRLDFMLTGESHEFYEVRSLTRLRTVGGVLLESQGIKYDEWSCLLFVCDGTVLGESHLHNQRRRNSMNDREASIHPLSQPKLARFVELIMCSLGTIGVEPDG